MKFTPILIIALVITSLSGCASLAGSSITVSGGYEGATGSITYTYNPIASTNSGSTVLTKQAEGNTEKSLSVILDSEEIKNLTDSVFASVKSTVPETDENRIKKLKDHIKNLKKVEKIEKESKDKK